MVDALVFWLAVAALGVAALPLAEVMFGRLPGRGAVLARPLGLLVVSFPPWLLASLGLVPFGRASAVLSAAALVAVAAVLAARGLGRVDRAGPDRRLWLAGEGLFAASFFAWSLLRSFSPDVWNTEKPMDMAFVNAAGRSDSFPPHDPWHAGSEINYYYYGHYLVAFVTRLTGVEPEVAYNLGVALFYALVVTTVFGVAAALYETARRTAHALRASPLAVGLTAALFAAVLGNLDGGVRFLRRPDGLGDYDWWSPSRVIDGTANEFPWFSFLLGDLHAHTMVTPLTLVVLAYALQLGVTGPPALRRARSRSAAELLLAGLVLGSLYAVNSFDFPTALAFGTGALLVWALDAPGRWRAALVWGTAWALAAVALFLPFWLSFSPPASSIGRIRDHTSFSTFAREYVLIYGVFLWSLAALYATRFRVPRRYAAWLGSLALFVLVLLAPPRLTGIAVALVLVALALYATLASGRFSLPYRLLWLITAVALALVASGEVVYLRDAFDGTESFRFNTVFKTGYQAWFLLAIVAAVVVHWSAEWLTPRRRRAWLAPLVPLVALALVYPVAGTYAKSGSFAATPSLDGMRWLREAAPDDARAIEWLRRNVSGAPRLVEAVGRDFDPEGRGRVSTYTGLPTVIAWPGHTVQWGHDPGTRARDVERLYRTTDLRAARGLLGRYGVEYVFVGSLERTDYPPASLTKFDRLGTVAFRSGGTTVYRVVALSR